MSMYASNAGKSGGEFFTPQQVSELLIRLATIEKTEVDSIYDPACGSGSLFLRAEEILGKDKILRGFFGQEINITTYNLCRMNMLLHGISFDKFNIACEDTLISPQHCGDKPFEIIVSNPPFSIKWIGDENPLLINDQRFAPAGVLAPNKKADFAFIMHSIAWLKDNGIASIVCFTGILSRYGKEQKIRKYLVDNNFIDCVIQLPKNLFFNATIATCILVLKKNNKKDKNILFIDASKEYIKVKNNNRLDTKNISNIVSCFEKRKDIDYFAKLASYELIKENDYDLSVSTYVKKDYTKKEIVDIQKLNEKIEEIVIKEEFLRTEIKKIIEDMKK